MANDVFLRDSRTRFGRTSLDPQTGEAYQGLIERAFGANLIDQLVAASEDAGEGEAKLSRRPDSLSRALDQSEQLLVACAIGGARE
jgi:hypothetical protein